MNPGCIDLDGFVRRKRIGLEQSLSTADTCGVIECCVSRNVVVEKLTDISQNDPCIAYRVVGRPIQTCRPQGSFQCTLTLQVESRRWLCQRRWRLNGNSWLLCASSDHGQ